MIGRFHCDQVPLPCVLSTFSIHTPLLSLLQYDLSGQQGLCLHILSPHNFESFRQLSWSNVRGSVIRCWCSAIPWIAALSFSTFAVWWVMYLVSSALYPGSFILRLRPLTKRWTISLVCFVLHSPRNVVTLTVVVVSQWPDKFGSLRFYPWSDCVHWLWFSPSLLTI